MVLVKKSLALYGKNGIIADGTDENGSSALSSRRNCPATLRAALKLGHDLIIKKGPDRGQVQLSFASVILS